jgi:hypothetical protein
MKFVRWCRVTPQADGTVASLRGLVGALEVKFYLPDGSAIARVEIDEPNLVTVQALADLVVLPSLNAPADKLPVAVQTWLTTQGVIIATGDTVLNVLRTLRNGAVTDPARRLRILIDTEM